MPGMYYSYLMSSSWPKNSGAGGGGGTGLLVPFSFESSPIRHQGKSLAKQQKMGEGVMGGKEHVIISLLSLSCVSLSPFCRTDRQHIQRACPSLLRELSPFLNPLKNCSQQNQASSKGAGALSNGINSAVGTGALVARPVCKGCVWALEGANLRQAQLVCLLNSPSKVIRGDCGFALSKPPLTAGNLKTNNIILLGYPSR